MGGTGGANTITDEESLRYRTEGFRFAFVAAHLPAFSFCSDVDGHHLRVPVVHCDCHAGSDQLSLAGRTMRRGPHAPHRLGVLDIYFLLDVAVNFCSGVIVRGQAPANQVSRHGVVTV